MKRLAALPLNHITTKKFLEVVDESTRNAILSAIADHYRIRKQDALTIIVGVDAEHLLDYLTGAVRLATSTLMKRHGLA